MIQVKAPPWQLVLPQTSGQLSTAQKDPMLLLWSFQIIISSAKISVSERSSEKNLLTWEWDTKERQEHRRRSWRFLHVEFCTAIYSFMFFYLRNDCYVHMLIKKKQPKTPFQSSAWRPQQICSHSADIASNTSFFFPGRILRILQTTIEQTHKLRTLVP